MTDAAEPNEKIGYKRPPLHTRFQPGVSGNPRGRQKGVRNFAADVKRTLEIPVNLIENGKSKQASTQEALMRRLREKTLKGDARALETLLSLSRTHNEDFAGRGEDRSLGAEDQAILDACLEDLTKSEDRPDFISIERQPFLPDQLRELSLLKALGYTRFKIVDQMAVMHQRVPRPAREGIYVSHQFFSARKRRGLG